MAFKVAITHPGGAHTDASIKRACVFEDKDPETASTDWVDVPKVISTTNGQVPTSRATALLSRLPS
jgi:hypothetical protein